MCKVLLLMDRTEDSKRLWASILNGFDDPGYRRRLAIRRVLGWEEWQMEVKALRAKGFCVLVLSRLHTLPDAGGGKVLPSDILAWTVKYSPVPVFSLVPEDVGPGRALGAFWVAPEIQAGAAADLARSILGGARPYMFSAKPPKAISLRFSKRELQRLGITLLPEILSRSEIVE
ncbi:hypothetical protein [Pseudodesulfovibrio tunisiensis]|uniref:hypothetical protein n=1 Tax=Pseudodesulfovibrio tunisiensis TaxID=463192 RepID=UPI001FB3E71F|nr:hypothetical protein [Pseudodesulfovibrio tunisiensis]